MELQKDIDQTGDFVGNGEMGKFGHHPEHEPWVQSLYPFGYTTYADAASTATVMLKSNTFRGFSLREGTR